MQARLLILGALVAAVPTSAGSLTPYCSLGLQMLGSGTIDTETLQQLRTVLGPEIIRQLEEQLPETPRQSAPRRAGPPDHKLPDAAAKLVEWENTANAAAVQSGRPFEKLEYYEIELSHLETLGSAADLPKEVRDALVFEREGKKYLRWIVHPEDQKHGDAVGAYLRSKKLPATKRSGALTGYSTASRSLVVVGANGIPFSIKVGLDRAPGNFKRDKPHSVGDAESAIVMDRYLGKTVPPDKPLASVVLLREPAAWGIRHDGGSLAMSVRTLNGLEKKGDRYYLPGFSALHERVGRDIAKANGSDDPAAFWRDHYAGPLGRALGELAARTGVVYDSPHSQNFLVELEMRNGKLVPTGRIALRDFGDAYLIGSIAKKNGLEPGAGGYRFRETDLPVSVGFTQGGEAPKWLSSDAKKTWDEAFFRSFEASFVGGFPSERRNTLRRQMGRATLVGGGKSAQKNFEIPALAD